MLDVGKDAENLDLILGVLVDWVRRLQKRSLYSISRKPLQIENAEVFGPQKYFYII